MRDIAVVDVKESYCSVAVFSEDMRNGIPKGSATVHGSFLDAASGTAIKIKENLDGLSVNPYAVVLLLPRSLFHVSPLTVPAKNPAMLAQMLAFEAPRHFPMPPEQLVWDFFPSEQTASAFSVTVAGLKKSDFDAYFTAAEQAGILADVVSVSSLAFMPGEEREKRALADIQPEGFEISLLEGPLLVYSRFVRFKPRIEQKQFFTGGFLADGAAGNIASQIAGEVDHIRLVGGIETPEGFFGDIRIACGGNLRQAVADRVSVKPGFTSARVSLLPEAGEGEEVLAHTARLASAAGLYKKGASFNFIPPKQRRLRNYAAKRLLKIAAGVVAGLLVLWAASAFAVRWNALRGLKAELASLKKEALKDENVAVHMGEYESLFDEFNRFSSQKSFTLAMLEGLTSVLPKNTYLNEMEFRDCKVMMGGLSSEASSVLGPLEGSPEFKNAHMLGAVQSTAKGERFKAGMECE
ncbi:MAG: PilN domain-containing protein [Nitrospinae bacterium]|nr:PilN domain-containing protein [Nitrospinota bacterium]